MPESKNNKVIAIAVAAVLGVIVGGASGYAISSSMKSNSSSDSSMSMSETTPTANTKAADLRATLVSFGTEHMDLTYTAVATALLSAPSASADQAELVQNGKDLAAAVGSIYGDEAQKTFEDVWTIHLKEFVNYAVAGSKKDETGKAKALSNIDSQYTKPLAAYLAKANPNLPEDVLYSSLKEHVEMTAKMIDEQVAGNYDAATKQRNEGVKHLEGLMTTLANGIVKQYPNKF